MKFHPDKCKVVTIKHKPSPLAMLPFVAYHYNLGENLLSYADSETDLGVHVNKNFNFNEQCEIILTKANQKFGILKRTSHFVTCRNRRRVLYLALVRSQFEHCSPVWRPGSITMMNTFESFQKNALSGFSLRRKSPTPMRFISENVSKLIYLPYLSGLISMISVFFIKSFIKPFQSIFPITLHYTAEIVVFAELT